MERKYRKELEQTNEDILKSIDEIVENCIGFMPFRFEIRFLQDKVKERFENAAKTSSVENAYLSIREEIAAKKNWNILHQYKDIDDSYDLNPEYTCSIAACYNHTNQDLSEVTKLVKGFGVNPNLLREDGALPKQAYTLTRGQEEYLWNILPTKFEGVGLDFWGRKDGKVFIGIRLTAEAQRLIAESAELKPMPGGHSFL